MRKLLTFLGALLPCALMASTQYSINSGWQFQLTAHNDAIWQNVSIPHTWSHDDQDDQPGYFRGKGLYKRTLAIDSAAAGKQVYFARPLPLASWSAPHNFHTAQSEWSYSCHAVPRVWAYTI